MNKTAQETLIDNMIAHVEFLSDMVARYQSQVVLIEDKNNRLIASNIESTRLLAEKAKYIGQLGDFLKS